MPIDTTPDSSTERIRHRVLGLLTALPLIILFAGSILTAAAWHWTEHSNRDSKALRFDAYFQNLMDTLGHQIDMHTLGLRGINGLFAGSEQVTRDEFRNHVAAMRLAEHLPGVQAVGYALAVPATGLSAFVDRVHADGLGDYEVWPPSERTDYAPLLYVEPNTPDNSRALGFDLLTDSARGAALAHATRSGDVSMTVPLQLLSERDDDGAGGLVLYLPDYCTPEESDPPQAIVPQVCGWVFMGIHIDSAVESALRNKLWYFDSELAISITDHGILGEAHAVYRSAGFADDPDMRYQRQADLPLAGRTWRVTAQPLPQFLATHHSQTPQWVLAGGLVLTLLTALSSLLLSRNYRRLIGAIEHARETQRQLEASQERLKLSARSHREMFASNPIPMWVYDLETLRFLEVNEAAIGHYGYSREEFLGMKITDIRPEEDLPRLMTNIAAVTVGFDDEGSWRHLTRDGRCINVEIRSSVMNFNGQRAELVIARDVTARLQAETKLLARNQELERFNRLMVDRELAMIDLKREVNRLSERLGVPPPYDLAAIDRAGQSPDPGEAA